jgi:hypothetical protein
LGQVERAEQRGVLKAGDGLDRAVHHDQHHDAVGPVDAEAIGQVGGHGRVPIGAAGHQPDAVKPPVGGDGGEEPRDRLAADVAKAQGWHVQHGVLTQ